MLSIKLICVGKLKEKYWQDACSEYMKRLGAYCSPEIIEVKEEKLPQGASEAEERHVVEAESERLLDKAGKNDYLIALDVKGREMSSEEIAAKLSEISFTNSSVAFIIGGSLGLSEELNSKADAKVSFGRITMPHQLARVVALEQIYRAFKINAGETYHK